MMLLSPLAEFLVLEAEARRDGLKWAQRLGQRLPVVRALLPPVDPVAFAGWDAAPLLAALRTLVTSRLPSERSASQMGESVCALAERGRLAAARARLRGEVVGVRPRPSAALRAELQAKSPEPEPGTTVDQDEWEGLARRVEDLRAGLAEDRRTTMDALLAAARMQRGTSAPGPDGWSGGYLRRLSTLFPRQLAELLWRDFVALTRGADPLRISCVTDASVGGLPKPGGAGHRPIVIARVTTRCIVAHVTRQSKERLRARLEARSQFALTGVVPAVLAVLVMAAKCARAEVPWVITEDDYTNAFGDASQKALAAATLRLAQSAPEVAACSLREHCMIREPGFAERVVRGLYETEQERLSTKKHARGGNQGSPSMPAVFGEVVAEVDHAAEEKMRDIHSEVDVAPAARALWDAMREISPGLAEDPPE